MSCNCGCGGKSQTKKWSTEPKFSELKKGDKVEIVGYNDGDSAYKSKLLSMGLVRGVQIEVLQAARCFRTDSRSVKKKPTFSS